LTRNIREASAAAGPGMHVWIPDSKFQIPDQPADHRFGQTVSDWKEGLFDIIRQSCIRNRLFKPFERFATNLHE